MCVCVWLERRIRSVGEHHRKDIEKFLDKRSSDFVRRGHERKVLENNLTNAKKTSEDLEFVTEAMR